MAFNIDTFTAKLKSGGALGSLFECELTAAKGSGSVIGDFKFMCKEAVLPASTIEQGTVTYMGRALQIPGNRAAQQLTTTVYNDEDMAIRNHIESWMELINSNRTNARSAGMAAIGSYTGALRKILEYLKFMNLLMPGLHLVQKFPYRGKLMKFKLLA